MRKRRNPNRIVNIFDLNRLKPTNIEATKPETAKDFYARLEREEKERQERPLREAQDKLTATIRQIHSDAASFWALPLETMRRADGDAFTASYVSLGLPTAPETADPKIVARAGRREFDNFVASLPGRGYTLSQDGILRFGSMCQCQCAVGGVWLAPTTLRRIFDWLVQFSCFNPDELVVDTQTVEAARQGEQPEPEPTFDDWLTRYDGSRDADKKLRHALDREVYSGEFGEMFRKWRDSVRDNFHVSLQTHHFDTVSRFFRERNLSPLRPDSFDAARRHLVNVGLLPETCLTCREVLEAQLRRAEISNKQFLQRCHALNLEGKLDAPRSNASWS